jgi:dTDP-4-dehydrorhamnose reductase
LRVAVLGARGQLGAAAVQEFASGHDVLPFDHAALDIRDARAVQAMFERMAPEVIVNCAGYNAVDAAEDHPVDALEVNALAVRTLARVARAGRATLVHYSSDFVFDGEGTAPYGEQDPPSPRSFYAMSKLFGEWLAADAPFSYILRVESLFGEAAGGPPPKGSVATIVGALREGRSARVFVDRMVSPTYVCDAVRATRQLLERRAAFGVYHCVNSGSCTWLELGREAAKILGVEPRFEMVRVADVPLRAPRPKYSRLSNQKLLATGIVMPTWQDALERYLRARDTRPRG